MLIEMELQHRFGIWKLQEFALPEATICFFIISMNFITLWTLGLSTEFGDGKKKTLSRPLQPKHLNLHCENKLPFSYCSWHCKAGNLSIEKRHLPNIVSDTRKFSYKTHRMVSLGF